MVDVCCVDDSSRGCTLPGLTAGIVRCACAAVMEQAHVHPTALVCRHGAVGISAFANAVGQAPVCSLHLQTAQMCMTP